MKLYYKTIFLGQMDIKKPFKIEPFDQDYYIYLCIDLLPNATLSVEFGDGLPFFGK